MAEFTYRALIRYPATVRRRRGGPDHRLLSAYDVLAEGVPIGKIRQKVFRKQTIAPGGQIATSQWECVRWVIEIGAGRTAGEFETRLQAAQQLLATWNAVSA